MITQVKPCRNAAELVNPVQVTTDAGALAEWTHCCMQAHTPEHEYFNLMPGGLCPFEDGCPHYEAKE